MTADAMKADDLPSDEEMFEGALGDVQDTLRVLQRLFKRMEMTRLRLIGRSAQQQNAWVDAHHVEHVFAMAQAALDLDLHMNGLLKPEE